MKILTKIKNKDNIETFMCELSKQELTLVCFGGDNYSYEARIDRNSFFNKLDDNHGNVDMPLYGKLTNLLHFKTKEGEQTIADIESDIGILLDKFNNVKKAIKDINYTLDFGKMDVEF